MKYMDALIYFNMFFRLKAIFVFIYHSFQTELISIINHMHIKRYRKKYMAMHFELFEYFSPLFPPPSSSLSTYILIKLRQCTLQLVCVIIAPSI